MKIVHFSTTDKGGGAAKASLNLHNSFLSLGIQHYLLVLKKKTSDPMVIECPPSVLSKFAERLTLELNTFLVVRYFKLQEYWSLGLGRKQNIIFNKLVKSSDLLSLSWVSGFLSIEETAKIFNSGKPIVWTLYDMWAFTGGCHYSQFCNLYEKNCISCPQLAKPFFWDISNWVWKRKRQWNLENVTVVCPSHWLASCAAKSSIFRGVDIRVIPTGINLNVFSPMEKELCRDFFTFPQHKKLILFAADGGLLNERKGGMILQRALFELSEKMNDLPELVLLGGSSVADEVANHYKVHYPRIQNDRELAHLYAACDVTVIPSQEENLALTVLESMACGTPCVAFDIGGMPDVIQHKKNGFLAEPFDVNSLAQGIQWTLNHAQKEELAAKARKTIKKNFTIEKEAEQYKLLFQDKLSNRSYD